MTGPISKIVNSSCDNELISVLETFDAPYHFERAEERNLSNWYEVLDCFDRLLERYVSEYDIFGKAPTAASDESSKNQRQSSSQTSPSSNPSEVPRNQVGTSTTASQSLNSSIPAVALPSDSESSGLTDLDSTTKAFLPSPKCVRLILRQTRKFIRNASHDSRHLYNSVEHLTALLADGHPAIVFLALEVLHLLYQKSTKYRASHPGVTSELIQRLMDVSTGWGGRERGMGLVECCSASMEMSLPTDGKQVHFKYVKSASGSSSDVYVAEKARRDWNFAVQESSRRKSVNGVPGNRPASSTPLPLPPSDALDSATQYTQPTVTTAGLTTSVIIEDIEAFTGDERWFLTSFASKHGIPKVKLFSLLYACRRARAFSQGRVWRMEACILRMYALTILFLLQPMQQATHDRAKETELLQDVVAIARAEKRDGLDDVPLCLRSICVRFLIAFAADRHRLASVLSATGLGIHHGSLTTLLRSEIRNILDNSGHAVPSPTPESRNGQVNQVKEESIRVSSATSETEPFSVLSECTIMKSSADQLQVVESLLALVHSVAVPTSSPNTALFTSSGVLTTLIPLISDRNENHSRVVTRSIRAMQAIIEGSSHSSGTQVFREQNGLSLIAERIALEVGIEDTYMTDVDYTQEDEKVEVSALESRGESRAFYERLGQRQMTPEEACQHAPPSSSATSRGQLAHSEWSLLRSLHQLLIPALGSGGNEVRQLVANSKLSRSLRKILGQPFYHGGSLFQSAASVTASIAHAEPTATVELVNAGIASTVLRSIAVGLPPCGEAIKCIPNLLAALCLAPSARDIIVPARPLKNYLLRLATPFYTRALHGEIPNQIGNGIDELVRHVESLRKDGMEALEEYIRISAAFVDAHGPDAANSGSLESVDSPFIAFDLKQASKTAVLFGDGAKSTWLKILLDKKKLAIANNACRLAAVSQNSLEHQESLVKGSGVRDMICMRKAAAYACSEAAVRDGVTFYRHYPTPNMLMNSLVNSLRTASARHPVSVLKVLFSAILDDAANVLKVAKELGEAWLPEEEHNLVSRLSPHFSKEGPQVEQRERELLREDLKDRMKLLRVDTVLLSGLLRGALGSSLLSWDDCGGPEIVAAISCAERAARYHLATVYTGLVLSATDGDLACSTVTAVANTTSKPLQATNCIRYLGNVDKLLGAPVSRSKEFEEACRKLSVPPHSKAFPRQKVKGLAWHLVTFAVAVQNLYSTLSKGLTFTSRRSARNPSLYAACASSVAATIGRVFVLHLQAAESLWDIKVCTMGDNNVIAAWDYIRGVLIEIKSTIFDEHRRGTQSMVLKSFFEAGGFAVLLAVIRPMEIVRVISRAAEKDEDMQPQDSVQSRFRKRIYRKQGNDPLATAAYLLALSEALPPNLLAEPPKSGENCTTSTPETEKSDMDVSSDSVTNQAKGIATIVVTDSDTSHEVSSKATDDTLCALLRDKNALETLRHHVKVLSEASIQDHRRISVRKVASDVWNSLCGFLLSLGSCPGLLGTEGAVNEPLNSSVEWTKEEIQRTALAAALRMVHPAAKSVPDLLSVLRQDESASADFVALVHTASHVAKDVCKGETTDVPEPNGNDASNSRPDMDTTDIPPRSTPSPDPSILPTLTEMGFSERMARTAIRRTAPGGLEHATEWLLSHVDGDVDSVASDDERNWERDDQGSGDEQQQEPDSNRRGGDGDQSQSENEVDGRAISRRMAQDVLTVPRTPNDEVMMDSASAGPVHLSENEHSHRGSSPSLSSKDNDDERETLRALVRRLTSSTSKSLCRTVDTDAAELLERSVRMDIRLLRSALKQSTKLEARETSEIVRVVHQAILDHQPINEQESMPSYEYLKILPVHIDTFKDIKQGMFQSLIEVIQEIVQHAKRGTEDLSFLCVELLSALRQDGTLTNQSLKVISKVINESLTHALNTNPRQDISAVGRVATLLAHYGGYRSRMCLAENGVFELAFKTLRRLVSDLEAVSKDPNVDQEATQPIKQLSIKEDQGNGIARNTESRKRRFVERGTKDPQAFSPPIKTESEVPHVPSRDEEVILHCMTSCMLLLDARYRYEFKDTLIDFSKAGIIYSDGDGHAKKEHHAGDKMDTEAASGNGVERAIVQLTNALGDGSPRSEEAREDADVQPNDVDMESLSGTASQKQAENNGGDVDEELARIKTIARKHKEAAIDRTVMAIREMVPDFELDESQRLQRRSVFDICMQCIRMWRNMKVGDTLVACLQLMASITRDWDIAKKAYETGSVPVLLALPQLDTIVLHGTDYRTVRVLVKTILRHIVEDPKTLEEAMIAEIYSLVAQPRARSAFTVKYMLSASAPMMSRSMTSFVSAASHTVEAFELLAGSQLQLHEQGAPSFKDMVEKLNERPNIMEVVSALSHLLVSKSKKDAGPVRSVVPSGSVNSNQDLTQFALETLAELIQLFQMAAVAFLSTKSPSKAVDGSALDYVVQTCLPFDSSNNYELPSLAGAIPPNDELSVSPTRKLLYALCSKSANTHNETIKALAAAAKVEAGREVVNVDAVRGIASCVTSGTKLRVLRAMLKTDLANDLAKSLNKLDASVSKNFEVAAAVLKALAFLGQASAHIAMTGDSGDDEISFSSSSRRHW